MAHSLGHTRKGDRDQKDEPRQELVSYKPQSTKSGGERDTRIDADESEEEREVLISKPKLTWQPKRDSHMVEGEGGSPTFTQEPEVSWSEDYY